MMEDAGVMSTDSRLSILRQAKGTPVVDTSTAPAAQGPQSPDTKSGPTTITASSMIAQAVDPLYMLRKVNWLQVDPLEFSDAYRQSA